MKRLINVEDKYGVFDLYAYRLKLCKNVPGKELIQVNNNVFIQRACSSPAVFSLNEQILEFIVESSISEVIFVFDLDAFNGSSDILTYDLIENKIQKTHDLLEKVEVVCKFVPVCYMAESIALLNYVSSQVPCVENYVHYENYKEYIVQLVGCLSGRSHKMVKKFHQYLDIGEMLSKMKNIVYDSNPNRYLYDFLTSEISDTVGLSFADLPAYFENVGKLFQERVACSKESRMMIGEDVIDLSLPFKEVQTFLTQHKGAQCIKFVRV